MSSYLRQELIPTHLGIVPRAIVLRTLSLRDIGAITNYISSGDSRVLGLSLRISPRDSSVDVVAFATSTHVFQVSLTDQASQAGTRRLPTDDSFARLLGNMNCHLAAFDMARVALHLYGQCRVNVKGVDLSTLFATSDGSPDPPAKLACDKLHPDVNQHRIHAAWYRDEVQDVCLRAWLSAVCALLLSHVYILCLTVVSRSIAETSLDALDYASKVDTSTLPDAHLQCLAGLMKNVALLEAEKPTRMENDFEDVALDGDGQLVILNERYNTRVRRSKQVRLDTQFHTQPRP